MAVNLRMVFSSIMMVSWTALYSGNASMNAAAEINKRVTNWRSYRLKVGESLNLNYNYVSNLVKPF